MAKVWRKINKKYAFNLAKRETHKNSKQLIKSFNRFFSYPFLNWFRLVDKL